MLVETIVFLYECVRMLDNICCMLLYPVIVDSCTRALHVECLRCLLFDDTLSR